jgi:hypothetical protein
MDDLKNLNPEFFRQMALALDGVAEEESYITAEEAAVRSETARQALEMRSLTLTPALSQRGEGEGKEGEGGIQGEVRGIIPEWMEDYFQLLDAGWPWRVAAYISWAACPRKSRWPKTQAELATEVLGLNGPRVINTWRGKNPAIDLMVGTLSGSPLLEYRADVMQALAESASDRDHRSNPDRKLFLELTGDYVPRSKVDVKNLGLNEDELGRMSNDDLAMLAKKILKQEEGDGNGNED